MTDDASLASFTQSLIAFQAEMPHVGKDNTAKVPTKTGGQYTYQYTDLTSLHNIVLPLLTKHGFAWVCRPSMVDGQFVLAYSLMHVDGHAVHGLYPLPQGTAQEIGSAITYSRRYALCAVLGIAPGGEDDDGQKASEARPQPRQRAAKPEAVPPLLAARNRVQAIADRLGWDRKGIADAYNSDTDADLLSATADQLNNWADMLEASNP